MNGLMNKNLEDLKKEREKTINRWEELGLLEGLTGNIDKDKTKLFESKTSHLINEKPIKIMQTLKLADDLFPSLIEGNKRMTIRRGYRDIRLGDLLFEGASDDSLQKEVEVVEVTHIRVAGVSDEECQNDGFNDWIDFYQGMKKYYPDLEVTEECTLIYFE